MHLFATLLRAPLVLFFFPIWRRRQQKRKKRNSSYRIREGHLYTFICPTQLSISVSCRVVRSLVKVARIGGCVFFFLHPKRAVFFSSSFHPPPFPSVHANSDGTISITRTLQIHVRRIPCFDSLCLIFRRPPLKKCKNCSKKSAFHC